MIRAAPLQYAELPPSANYVAMSAPAKPTWMGAGGEVYSHTPGYMEPTMGPPGAFNSDLYQPGF